jgi:beta-1,4-N-acetylglucosaminyltransferase
MIYVTVGGQYMSFDRLINKIDEIALSIPEQIILQKGVSKIIPVNIEFFDFVDYRKAEEYIKNSKLVISHAGVGTINLAMKYCVPIIIMPRRKKYGELFNDHQLQVCDAVKMEKMNCIYIVEEVEELRDKILYVLSMAPVQVFHNKEGVENLINEIREFVESNS